MKPGIFRAVAAGLLIGSIAFFFPPLFFILLIVFLVRRLFFAKHTHGRRWEFIERIRNMSDEEFAQWKTNAGNSYCHPQFIKAKT